MSDAPRPTRLVVGYVRRAHGLRGAVRIESLTDRPERRFAVGARLHREGEEAVLTVVESAPEPRGWRVRFAEITDRSAAEELQGAYLEADVADEPLGPGEYYWHEVVGATVRDLEGRTLGTVRDVYRAGGGEVFVVQGGPPGSFDVPAVREVVRVFAPERGEIVVDRHALGLADGEAHAPRSGR
ncbi:MAG TPA: ribosome maturation factor RimM [Candidatus Limnocylindrales bacterium]|nr:ribosome maturation factor RimM [Candidatus Limnocylindrales bacterium]